MIYPHNSAAGPILLVNLKDKPSIPMENKPLHQDTTIPKKYNIK
jgi:hypothetical protein